LKRNFGMARPEGCASILWKDSEKMREAAEALRLTAQDLLNLGVADQIISEPMGGAHRGREQTITAVGNAIRAMLSDLDKMKPKKLVAQRRQKFLDIGSKGLAA
jgi:acetyl-CoA carboxylase carboxyl transferase subunit alpha